MPILPYTTVEEKSLSNFNYNYGLVFKNVKSVTCMIWGEAIICLVTRSPTLLTPPPDARPIHGHCKPFDLKSTISAVQMEIK